MDGANLSRHPHLSWLRFRLRGSHEHRSLVLPMQSVALTVCCTFRGRQDVRRITRGSEVGWHERKGTVNVLPADGQRHVFLTRMSADLDTVVFLIPLSYQRAILDSDGASASSPLQLLTHDDPVLVPCMTRLAAVLDGTDADGAERADEAARRLLLRLAALSCGKRPDWHEDWSVFDRRTIARLVERLDDDLKVSPSLDEMACGTGLSPSHFGRKFRHSTGLSLHRFVNRRRILRSLESLPDDSLSLAQIALDLGFASQSHFTRLFSMLTGMTPAKYRKRFRRTLG